MARRSDHTHDEIRAMAVAAARAKIENAGLDKVTLRGIARDIGYSPGTLYNVFDSADELMMRVNAGTIDDLVAALSAAERNGAEPDLRALLAIYRDFVEQNRHRWQAVFDYSLSDPGAAPDWYVAKLNDGLAVVERAVARLPGDFPYPPAVVARVIWAGLHGIFSLGAEGNLKLVTDRDAADLAEALIALIDRAIRH
ncbi:TetR/AcrR family transcriptional regulator [Minwuia thermotolerans]|uniref:HTH tetR-type domain-containing protein n=1 Tax=Minwuia thermotolerans TaxID=2056226 RepID=A0A2M9FX53_9PROT|nr:TetR-like C-terminal domain-containing protein [Minwuia thermotolerans]PJK28040.1 hypothetical protein CVT23_18550 [Minwuia thermotolerans]